MSTLHYGVIVTITAPFTKTVLSVCTQGKKDSVQNKNVHQRTVLMTRAVPPLSYSRDLLYTMERMLLLQPLS